MPKRSYPFDESFSSQYKIHIGQRELNHGVLGYKYKQEIYEKTKNLMFNGAKAVVGKLWNGAGERTSPTSAAPAETPTAAPAAAPGLLRGQTTIGFNGKLQRNAPVEGAAVAASGCCVCLKALATLRSCSECERPACPSCTQQCSSCANLCCSVCTVVDYSGRYDQVLCCGCST
ncbi:apoptosis regulatory protein Siva [Osmerus eperlanus]|uniref:apoptosis regulatory protein Siva n=1 Tax=Osmerus eperlanus TaxID=29151 RepID=UPI002E112A97